MRPWLRRSDRGWEPSAPPPRGRFPIDTVPGSASTAVCRLTRVKILFPAPRVLYPGQSPNTRPPPLAGGGRRPRSGRAVGVIQRERFSVPRRDRGRGVPPPPRQPLPAGAIPHRYSATGRRSSLCRQREHPAEIQFLSPGTVSGLSPCTARPLSQGAGGGRGAAGRWG
jgi:hypothetical protein